MKLKRNKVKARRKEKSFTKRKQKKNKTAQKDNNK